VRCSACRLLVRELDAGALEPDEVDLVNKHLEACGSCRAFQGELRADWGKETHRSEVSGKVFANALRPEHSRPRATVAVIALLVAITVVLAAGAIGWPHHREGGHRTGRAGIAAWSHR